MCDNEERCSNLGVCICSLTPTVRLNMNDVQTLTSALNEGNELYTDELRAKLDAMTKMLFTTNTLIVKEG